MQYFLDDSGNFENFVKIWPPTPPNYYQNASKNTRKIMESSWKHIIYVNLGLTKFRFFFNSGPTRHLFFLEVFCPPPPPKIRLVYMIVFEGHWPWYVLENLWRPIILTKCKIISKSQWIKNIFQGVTYHLTKNLSPHTFLVFMDHSNFWFLSPRTFLAFMENHPFENFSPHTFLVFMENHGFEL